VINKNKTKQCASLTMGRINILVVQYSTQYFTDC